MVSNVNYNAELKSFWFETWSDHQLPDMDIFDHIILNYQEPQRYYHTTQHLYECLLLWQDVKDFLYQPQLVALALWFHDVVYQPQQHDNEEQSAELAAKLLTQTILDPVEIQTIKQYIRATKTHQNIMDDADLDFLLDIDLAILASPSIRFEEYEQQIRQEYSWVADEVYRQKRQQVLYGFYQKDRLYQTDYFYKRLELKAKQNLQEKF